MKENLIVVDLESTCCSDNILIPIADRETIEIGAVAICPDSGKTISEFVSFVRPVKNKNLTQFCIDFTGITQADVESGEIFPEVWNNKFIPWLKEVKLFCSWGRYDLEQFDRDCKNHNLPRYFEKHCDASRLAGKNKRLVMKKLGVAPSGRPHRGLNDARNVASILGKLLLSGTQIQFKII